jgi:hypothetical protein
VANKTRERKDMAGEFLLNFFEEREAVDVKPNGEADVLCPFEHDKGYEKRPSAHINPDKGTFHCKTCRAEGRFNSGGLSEINFVAKYYNIKYKDAVRLVSNFEGHSNADVGWEGAKELLLSQTEKLKYLADRGITDDIVVEYELGYAGSGIIYPIFVNGVMLDKRTYNVNPEPGEPKIKSEAGAQPLLFPFDHWKADKGDTLLVGGENDALIARKLGFNGLTSTGGEGTFPVIFAGLFKGKKVYIAYDCDGAGKKGARMVAFKLKEAGADVWMVDLGLEGTKKDKDLTDFVINHGYGAKELQEKIDCAVPYDGELFQEDKDEQYPLVDLWNVPHGEYSSKYISSRVIMMGKIDTSNGTAMEAPAACHWECYGAELDDKGKSPCWNCPLYRSDKTSPHEESSGWWTLDTDNLDTVLKLVEVPEEEQHKNLRHMIGMPVKCPNGRHTVRDKVHINKVIFTPDVETESELHGFRMTEMFAYTIGLDLEDGQRYRAYFKRYPHPKNQAIVTVVDRVEESDAGVNAFQINEEMIAQLSQFQGDPTEQMDKRFQLAKDIIAPSVPRNVFEAVNIMYHSVLDFKFHKSYMKGHPEGLIVGASRTGKTETAVKWQQFLGVGNMTNVKGASVAGLVGGVEGMASGGYRIKWGTIPRNNKGLLVLDEMSGIPQEVIAKMTALRSERKAIIEKIASGMAPAKTRLLWISNQRKQMDKTTKPIQMYNDGVEVARELVGSNEDIARFDFIVVLPETKTLISPFESLDDLPEVDNTPYKNLVYWAWSRNKDQIKFDTSVDKYIWNVSLELNEKYATEGLDIFSSETFKKIARIAVACAGFCFSHTGDGDNILVRKEHVDWARDFLVRCYDNDIFRLPDFVSEQKALTDTNEQIDTIFASIAKSHPMVLKAILKGRDVNMYGLQMLAGLDKEDLAKLVSNMYTHGMIKTGANGRIEPTLRLRNARKNYVNGIQKQKLIPLSEEGVMDV